MKRILIIPVLLCMFCLPLNAAPCDGTITGRLVDGSSGKAISYADIFLFPAGSTTPVQQTIPDDEGRFSFIKVKDGNYSVMARLLGYDVLTKGEITIASGKGADMGTLSMTPLETGIAEVKVVAHKRQVIYKLDKKVVDASANIAGSGGSAVDVLENTPSVRIDADGEVTFRGSTGFVVYVDGKPSAFTG